MQGGIMKTILATLLIVSSLSPAIAGGLPEPVMEEEVIITDTASSGGDEWVGIMMTVLVLGAAAAGR
jgi:hypothetical protein